MFMDTYTAIELQHKALRVASNSIFIAFYELKISSEQSQPTTGHHHQTTKPSYPS